MWYKSRSSSKDANISFLLQNVQLHCLWLAACIDRLLWLTKLLGIKLSQGTEEHCPKLLCKSLMCELAPFFESDTCHPATVIVSDICLLFWHGRNFWGIAQPLCVRLEWFWSSVWGVTCYIKLTSHGQAKFSYLGGHGRICFFITSWLCLLIGVVHGLVIEESTVSMNDFTGGLHKLLGISMTFLEHGGNVSRFHYVIFCC